MRRNHGFFFFKGSPGPVYQCQEIRLFPIPNLTTPRSPKNSINLRKALWIMAQWAFASDRLNNYDCDQWRQKTKATRKYRIWCECEMSLLQLLHNDCHHSSFAYETVGLSSFSVSFIELCLPSFSPLPCKVKPLSSHYSLITLCLQANLRPNNSYRLSNFLDQTKNWRILFFMYFILLLLMNIMKVVLHGIYLSSLINQVGHVIYLSSHKI